MFFYMGVKVSSRQVCSNSAFVKLAQVCIFLSRATFPSIMSMTHFIATKWKWGCMKLEIPFKLYVVSL